MVQQSEISQKQQEFSTQSSKRPSTWQLDSWEKVQQCYYFSQMHNYGFSQREISALITQGKTASNKSLIDQANVAKYSKVLSYLVQQAPTQISRQLLIDIDDILGFNLDILNLDAPLSNEGFAKPAAFVAYEKINDFANAIKEKATDYPFVQAVFAHNKCLTEKPFVADNKEVALIVANIVLSMNDYPLLTFTDEQLANYKVLIASPELNQDNLAQLLTEVCVNSLEAYQMRYNNTEKKLMRIGEMAKQTGEAVHTIRYWTQLGLLEASGFTAGGYQLYDLNALEKAKAIREMERHERLSISEIKAQLSQLV
jgi:hypothetical protein